MDVYLEMWARHKATPTGGAEGTDAVAVHRGTDDARHEEVGVAAAIDADVEVAAPASIVDVTGAREAQPGASEVLPPISRADVGVGGQPNGTGAISTSGSRQEYVLGITPCFSGRHHYRPRPDVHDLITDVMLRRMHCVGPVCVPMRDRHGVRRASFGCDIAIDDKGELVVEAYSGLNGKLVVHRFDDIRERVEAIHQAQIDHQNDTVDGGDEEGLAEGDGGTGGDGGPTRKRRRREPAVLKLAPKHESHYESALSLSTNRDLTACTWSPSHQDVVACCAASDNHIALYDLRYCGSRPTEKLLFSVDSDASFSSRRSGLSSLRYQDAGGNVIMASSEAADILVFDRRAKLSVCGILGLSEYTGGLNSVSVHPDGNSVISGSQDGRICVWDVRRGLFSTGSGSRSTGVAFATATKRASRHLTSMTLWPSRMLERVLPAVASTTRRWMQNSAVYATALDPSDPRRLGLHTAIGMSAVIDVPRSEITHLYCPPSLDENSLGEPGDSARHHAYAWRVRRRRCCWAGNSNLFCAPAIHSSEALIPETDQEVVRQYSSALHVLDFSASLRSRCRIDGIGSQNRRNWQHVFGNAHSEGRDGSEDLQGKRKIPLEAPGVGIAAHPFTDELLVSDTQGNLNLIGCSS